MSEDYHLTIEHEKKSVSLDNNPIFNNIFITVKSGGTLTLSGKLKSKGVMHITVDSASTCSLQDIESESEVYFKVQSGSTCNIVGKTHIMSSCYLNIQDGSTCQFSSDFLCEGDLALNVLSGSTSKIFRPLISKQGLFFRVNDASTLELCSCECQSSYDVSVINGSTMKIKESGGYINAQTGHIVVSSASTLLQDNATANNLHVNVNAGSTCHVRVQGTLDVTNLSGISTLWYWGTEKRVGEGPQFLSSLQYKGL